MAPNWQHFRQQADPTPVFAPVFAPAPDFNADLGDFGPDWTPVQIFEHKRMRAIDKKLQTCKKNKKLQNKHLTKKLEGTVVSIKDGVAKILVVSSSLAILQFKFYFFLFWYYFIFKLFLLSSITFSYFSIY